MSLPSITTYLVLILMSSQSLPAWAQSPLSDGLILGSSTVQEQDFGSDRYTTKKTEPVIVPHVGRPRLDQSPRETSRKIQSEKSTSPKEVVQAEPQSSPEVSPPQEPEDPAVDPRDTRRNIVEVGVGLGYLYNDADSSSWFRRYHTSGGLVRLESRLWLSSSFGIQGTYSTSFGHSISSHPPGHNSVAVDHQTMEIGIRYRRFFGAKMKSPSLTLGVDHREYRFGVTSGEQQRTNLMTTGVRLMAELQIPDSIRSRWDLGIEIVPRASHREIKSQAAIKSGSKNQTDVLGLWAGETYTLNRSNQVYWRVSHTIERSIFSGASSPSDPLAGATLQGVSVSNSMTMFTIGYFWGE